MTQDPKEKPEMKAREFWLVSTHDFEIGACTAFKDEQSASSCVAMIKRSNNPCILHVISYDAYSALLAHAERMSAALNYVIRHKDDGIQLAHITINECGTVCEQALKDFAKWKELL